MTMMTPIGKSATGLALGLGGSANLRTPCGPRRVENIRAGDLIVTRNNGLQPVRMVWTVTVSAAEMTADPALAPIRLKPRAIGPMMPTTDLVIAPDHKVLVPGYRLAGVDDRTSCLVAARHLAGVSDAAYVDRSEAEVTYYNVVFDSHEVVCANGMPVESFRPVRTLLSQLDASVSTDISRLFPAVRGGAAAFPALDYPAPDGDDARPEFV